MRKKRRNGRVTTETSIEDEIVHLRGLDLNGLRARWRSVLQRPAPDHLPRHLVFAIIAYRIQVDRSGDLDHETRQLLDRTGAKESGTAMSARLVSFDQKRTELTPGTVLVREWDRRSQRVMVMADGFAWNGQTYDSLSKVAFAITGTKWNGPRFFGFRDKEDRSTKDAEPIHIDETDTTFAIGWNGHYRIEGPAFIYVDRDTGRTSTILGYPTHQLTHIG